MTELQQYMGEWYSDDKRGIDYMVSKQLFKYYISKVFTTDDWAGNVIKKYIYDEFNGKKRRLTYIPIGIIDYPYKEDYFICKSDNKWHLVVCCDM